MKTISAAARDAVGSEEPIAAGGWQDFRDTLKRAPQNQRATVNKQIFAAAHDAVG